MQRQMLKIKKKEGIEEVRSLTHNLSEELDKIKRRIDKLVIKGMLYGKSNKANTKH